MKKLDIYFDLKDIHHVSLKDALALDLISPKSPVNTFFNEYMTEEQLTKFKLVIYAGSEMIGPSVQVAELAGCITEELLNVDGQYEKKESSFLFLDIFSGSSSTTIPAVSRFKNKRNKFIAVKRIDSKRPSADDDYLHLLFKDDKNIDASNYEPSDVFSLINSGKPEDIFCTDQHAIYDLCVADPPHYLTLNFLIGKKDKYAKCFCDVLQEKTKVFIIYYAHKEQENLCDHIRYELSRYFKFIYRVIVGSEEMAVCYNHSMLTPQVVNGLSIFRELYKSRYHLQGNLNIFYQRSYPENKINRLGNLIVLSGPSGCGKDTTINKIIKEKDKYGVGIERVISVKTREKREGENVNTDGYFINEKEFLYRTQNKEFAEYAPVFGGLYAIPIYEIIDRVTSGIDVIMDIGADGIGKLIEHTELSGINKIFILLHPTGKKVVETLRNIVKARQSLIADADLDRRAHEAIREIERWEKAKSDYSTFPNSNFVTMAYDAASEADWKSAQHQILYYVIRLSMESLRSSGKEIYSKSRAFRYFYEIIKEEKEKTLSIIKGEVTLPKTENFLDIGAGTGDLSKLISDHFQFSKSYLVEPSVNLLNESDFDKTKTSFLYKSWESVIEEDLISIGLDGSFNLITSFNVNFSDWDFSISKISRYLDENGICILSFVDPDCYYSKITTQIKTFLKLPQQKDLTVEELRSKCHTHSFDFTEHTVDVDVEFRISKNPVDRYIFKFMFGKWLDELNDEESQQILSCLREFEDERNKKTYSLRARHYLFICYKRTTPHFRT